jgi:membrane protein involved in colicin uptake
MKFQYLLSDGQQQIMEIDGDEFAECDYGLVIDNGHDTQKLSQNMEVLAQTALQNQYSLSSVMKLFTSNSLMEKIRILEREEQQKMEQAQQIQQQEMQIKQAELEQKMAIEQAKQEQEYKMNQENNDTKVLVAEINSQAEADRLALMNGDDGIEEMSEEARAKLKEQARQFNDKQKLEREKFVFEQRKAAKEQALKEKQIANQAKRSTTKK